jgi:hypothetical protein
MAHDYGVSQLPREMREIRGLYRAYADEKASRKPMYQANSAARRALLRRYRGLTSVEGFESLLLRWWQISEALGGLGAASTRTMRAMVVQDVIAKVLASAEKLKASGAPNEANTKAILVEPMLAALGWDPGDLDHVTREVKVFEGTYLDYALRWNGSPKVYVEAKGIGESLEVRTHERSALSDLQDKRDRADGSETALRARSERFVRIGRRAGQVASVHQPRGDR